MIWHCDNEHTSRLVEVSMRPCGSCKYKAIRLKHFYNSGVCLGLHANTGSIISLFARGLLRPAIAKSHAVANQPFTASCIMALTSSSVSPCVTHPGRDGTSAQYHVSGARHL
jgi:hypothetical protein